MKKLIWSMTMPVKKLRRLSLSLTKHLKDQQKLRGDASVRIFSQTVWSLDFY